MQMYYDMEYKNFNIFGINFLYIIYYLIFE